MATYTGFVQSNNLFVNDDDTFLNLSINTRSEVFAHDGEEAQLIPEWVITTGVSATNIDFDEVVRTGVKWETYSDIFYNRIWIIPSSLDLTGAPTSFSTTISVWNSYFVQKTMTAATPTNISGITFAPTVPHTFNALEIQGYNLALTPAAPASINGNYQFIFSDAEDPYLLISGVLSVTFPFFHNWENTMLERISYLTNVIESKSGKEQRVRLRKYPRRQLEYNTLVASGNDIDNTAIQRVLFHNQFTFGKSKTWLIPVCQDYRYVGYDLPSGTSTINVDTQYHDYVDNGYVLLYKAYDDYEVVRIDSLTTSTITLIAPTTQDYARNSIIVPMRQSVFSDETSNGESLTYEIETFSTAWDVMVQDSLQNRTVPYIPTYVYKGYDVYMQTSDFSSNNSVEVYNPQRRLDNNTGIFSIDSRYKSTKERTDLRLLLKTKREIAEFLGFLDYRAGRLNSMWVPTYSKDIQITQAGSSGDTTIKIKNIGYGLFMQDADTRKDLVFMKTDGTPLFRRITGSSQDPSGDEVLSLDSSLGFNFTNNDFRYISFLRFSRLDSDITELSYITTDVAQVNMKIVDVFEIP